MRIRGQTELQLPEQLLNIGEPLKRFGPIEGMTRKRLDKAGSFHPSWMPTVLSRVRHVSDGFGCCGSSLRSTSVCNSGEGGRRRWS